MRKLSGLQWIIVLLTLATAFIHIYLGATTLGDNTALGTMFILDGIGYIVIMALLYFSGRVGSGRTTLRWTLILYALLTIILYFVFNGSDAFSSTLGLVTKAIEALLIILLFVDRKSDHVEIPVPTPAVSTTASRVTAEALAPTPKPATPAAGATATAAAAVAAAAAAKESEDTAAADRSADVSRGMSREALMDFFGDIDSITPDDWRAKLMGHLTLIGDPSQFDRPIEYIEGIGDVRGRKWRAINVTKTVDLLVYGATRKGRAALAKRSGFSESEILTWANQVDLYRITGVAKEYADLLEESGVDTVVELARRNAEHLQKQMVKTNEDRNLVRRTPTLAEVESWINQANTLPRVMHY